MIRRGERNLLAFSTLITGGTGVAYAWMKYLLRPADPFAVVNHPWQPGLMSVHLLAAPLLLFGFGLIFREHILERRGDSRGRPGRPTGLLAVASVGLTVASGYLLQVFTSAPARRVLGWLHLASGLLFLLSYGWHLARAARSRRTGGTLRCAGEASGGIAATPRPTGPVARVN